MRSVTSGRVVYAPARSASAAPTRAPHRRNEVRRADIGRERLEVSGRDGVTETSLSHRMLSTAYVSMRRAVPARRAAASSEYLRRSGGPDERISVSDDDAEVGRALSAVARRLAARLLHASTQCRYARSTAHSTRGRREWRLSRRQGGDASHPPARSRSRGGRLSGRYDLSRRSGSGSEVAAPPWGRRVSPQISYRVGGGLYAKAPPAPRSVRSPTKR